MMIARPARPPLRALAECRCRAPGTITASGQEGLPALLLHALKLAARPGLRRAGLSHEPRHPGQARI
jgi:hypothetical protein